MNWDKKPEDPAIGKSSIEKRFYSNGRLAEITLYRNGKKHGLEKEYCKDGKLIRKTPYVNDEKHGIEREYYSKKELIVLLPFLRILKKETPYEYGKREGTVKKYLLDGSLSEEIHYKEDQLHSMYNTYLQNGIKEICYYENGQPYYITEWVNGKKEGVEKIYREDGSIEREVPYVNGNIKGQLIKYRPNGKPWVKTKHEGSSIPARGIYIAEDGSEILMSEKELSDFRNNYLPQPEQEWK